jgi:hypothetical protein
MKFKKITKIGLILSIFALSGCTVPFVDNIKLPENVNKKKEVASTALSYEKNKEQEKIYEALKKENRLPAHNLKCIPVKKIWCKDNECRDVPLKFFSLIEKTSLSRCSEASCDTVKTVTSESEDYTTIQDRDSGGLIFKVAKKGEPKKYIEITTLELGSYESFGYCEEVK